jgi:ketose-bisphosphate aldolase
MQTLRKVLEQADSNALAIGHFNFSDLVTLKAIFEVARDLKAPVIVGVSEGEREFMGARQVAAVVKSLRDEHDFPIFLNADHTHSLKGALEAAEAGYDWIVFDASSQPFTENVRQTKAAVEAVKGVRPEILVEGEIGDIGSGSEIHDSAASLTLTTPLEAKHFVAETRIDTLAPAVGNMHGMLRAMVAGETKKRLDIERIRAIKAETRIFMTLHGASGTNDDDLRRAIAAGITVIHINTELRLAWRRGFDHALAKQPGEIVPSKIMSHVIESIKDVVKARMSLFGSDQIRASPPPANKRATG